MNNYNLWASFRRKMLDALLDKYKEYYQGIVLDIGGRDRGRFKKPKDIVKKWIFADINKNYNPDIILDISNMPQIESESIDVINAIELFEHVFEIERGLEECHRVLKREGRLIISVPFLFPIHSDPFDYQRWTEEKWKLELRKNGFKIEVFIIMGTYYTHLAEVLKARLKLSWFGKKFLIFLMPILNFLIKLDIKNSYKENSILNNYHNGYFMIAKKV